MLRACVAAPTDAMHGLISAFTCDIFLDLFMALLILAALRNTMCIGSQSRASDHVFAG